LWIVKQFESIRSDDSNQMLTDKFIPRPDAALVFHFKSIPKVVIPIEVKLKNFFVALAVIIRISFVTKCQARNPDTN